MIILPRRDFIRNSAAFGAGLSLFSCAGVSSAPSINKNSRVRLLSIGVVGTIGGADLSKLAQHPKLDVVGLCDVDDAALASAKEKYAKTVQFTCKDYREAFAQHADKFDAVHVATPDHSHCSIMTAALAAGKHLYGQKPVVQQLEEIDIMNRALKARPDLITQTGAQRIDMTHPASPYWDAWQEILSMPREAQSKRPTTTSQAATDTAIWWNERGSG